MHIASESGHQETALVFLKKGVPLHMSNKVSTIIPVLCQETYFTSSNISISTEIIHSALSLTSSIREVLILRYRML